MTRIKFPNRPELQVIPGGQLQQPHPPAAREPGPYAPPPASPPPSSGSVVYGKSYTPGETPRWMDDIQPLFPERGVIHSYCWWAAQDTDAPGRFHIGSILPIICHELARLGYYCQTPAGRLDFTWWSCLVGPSGSAKSTAIRNAIDFGRAFWEVHPAAHPPPFLQFEGSIPGVLSALGTDFYNPRTGCTEAILYREEFSRVLSNEGISEILCELIDGRTIVRQTRHAQKLVEAKQAQDLASTGGVVRNPRCNGMFATTTASLAAVVDDQQMNGGAFSRIHWLLETPKPEQMSPMRANTLAERTTALGTWHDWATDLAGYAHIRQSTVVELTEEVKQIGIDHLFEPFRAQMTGDHILNGARRRALEKVDILACVYAVSEGRFIVEGEDMERAVRFIERDLSALLTLSQQLSGNDTLRNAHRVMQVLGRHDTAVKTSTLLNEVKITTYLLGQALEHLMDADLVEKRLPRRTGKPGRPATRYALTRRGVLRLQSEHADLSVQNSERVSPRDRV